MIDAIAQLDLYKTVKLNERQKVELEARHACLTAIRLQNDGLIKAGADTWLKKDLARALNTFHDSEASYQRKYAEWERYGKAKNEPKPTRNRKLEISVQTLSRAIDLLDRGYPDTYDPGSVAAW